MRLILVTFFLCFTYTFGAKVNDETCEVCVKFVRRFENSLEDAAKGNMDKISDAFKKFCLTAKGKDERFCYYVGGLKTSATYIVNELAKPVSWGMPAEKVCEKLKAKDSQICDLKYEKSVDFSTVKFDKLKVKELKKILENWGEVCRGCTEKSEFIRLVKELLPKYEPEAAKKRKDEL
ncbi:hypothetical protein BOX15_Mlig027409g1 [Macrostomum lignano]|uniref:Mesencephalic astrocyte-derived neurotrophic factor homolog n=3 Tax=Macrostomum lignano TaxID=282301 RepID=A0A1I8HMC0_9PLAT|nr:hypothetical protein BOX15_Mlig027409g3 [Macrostomum lignano]PAA90491.1 hypothetical protein BOX15_Mlig027409g1 [Macrostomum lignano]